MKRIAAETLATFLLVFGVLVFSALASPGNAWHAAMQALVTGMLISGLVWVFGPISGAHLNPAVSVALARTPHFSLKECLPFVLAQCVGAWAASMAVSLFGLHPNGGGLTLPTTRLATAFGLEMIISAALMLFIMYMLSKPSFHVRKLSLPIGLFVSVVVWFAGPFSGASMNPARSLGPALVAGHFQNLWIYLVAPMAGMLLAVEGWQAIHQFRQKQNT